MSADNILAEREFALTSADLPDIQRKWMEVQQYPELCSKYEDWKENIEFIVETYLAYLNK